MDIPEMGWEGIDWIDVAEDRDHCKCGNKFYYMAEMYFRIGQNAGNSLLTVDLLAPQKGPRSMELVI